MASLFHGRPWAAAAAVVGFAMTAVYVVVILGEGDNSLTAVLPWAVVMASGGALAFAATQIADPPVARTLLIGATAIFGIIGTLAIFSIGLGFLLAAATALIAVVRLP